ncbi:MAG: hypothetical protein AB1468_01480 [Candidatus Micrarchaeota archaeon]
MVWMIEDILEKDRTLASKSLLDVLVSKFWYEAQYHRQKDVLNRIKDMIKSVISRNEELASPEIQYLVWKSVD